MSSDKSLTNRIWREKEITHNLIESLSQKKSISQLFSKLLLCREINEDNFDQFINPDILNNFPDPFELKDIKKGDKFSRFNIIIKRPGTGISPMKFEKILGVRSDFDFFKDDIIKIKRKL